MHDLVIRGGTVIGGTGSEPRTADVAIDDGRISAVGRISTAGKREINADGLAVTPGFVDVHTHYDAQATWDPHLTPSGLHGVTTAVCGNCGVGFAPVKNDEHDFLIGLMEGVEDIPGAALSAGIAWDWETFPEYLDALDRASLALDLGTQVPHGAVRAYVMGERGANNEPATADDITAMAAVVSEGIEAGALGFSTSRTILHTAVNGDPVPGTFAAEDELFGIGRVLGKLGAVCSSWRGLEPQARTSSLRNRRWTGCGVCLRKYNAPSPLRYFKSTRRPISGVRCSTLLKKRPLRAP